TGIRVLLASSGRELERLVLEQLEVVGEGTDVVARLAGRRGKDVALNTRGMLEDLPDGDVSDAWIGIVGPGASEVERRLEIVGALRFAVGHPVRVFEQRRAI